MPGHFGQKVLKTLGLNDHAHQQNSSAVRLPGRPAVNNDERGLSSPPNNGTYPRLCRLSDGTILSSFTRFPDGQRSLRVAKSTDNGLTFEDFSEVTRAAGDVDNMFLSEKRPPLGIWEPFMRVGRQGEVQLYFSQEFAHNNQCTMLVVSRDQGSTWTQPTCLHGDQDPLRDGMCGIARTFDNGREALLMVFETTRYGPFSVEALLSYDDGATWGWRHEVFRPRQGHNAGSPQIASFADGSMATIFMTDEDSNHVEWVKNASIKVVFASQPVEGRVQWSSPTLISPASSFWPGIMALDRHNVLATYDRGGPLAKTITWHPA
ncbi:Neuraminidase [Penicillium expansum]|nr:Neuraminidase [Penicillium expansum]